MTDDRIEGSLKTAGGRIQDAVGGLTGDNKTQAKGKLNELSGSVQDTVGKVKGQAQVAVDQAKSKADDISGDFQDFITDQPVLAIAIAVGVGVVLGLMLRGGRKTVYVRK